MSKYRYIGKDCLFANFGDIFEVSHGGKGYVKFDENGDYVTVPKYYVENNIQRYFVHTNDLEIYKEELVKWLAGEMVNSKFMRQETLSDVINHVKGELAWKEG